MKRYFEILDQIDAVGPEYLSSEDVYADLMVRFSLEYEFISADEADDMRQCAIARYRSRCYRFQIDEDGAYVERI